MFESLKDPKYGGLNQVGAMFAYFVNREGMLQALKSKNWPLIGKLYNGQESYGEKLRQLYAKL